VATDSAMSPEPSNKMLYLEIMFLFFIIKFYKKLMNNRLNSMGIWLLAYLLVT